MRLICSIFSTIIFLFADNIYAQVSSDCVTAVPICYNTPINGGTNGFGVDDFDGQLIACNGVNSGLGETNSAWYRFRTSASGQLGFNLSVENSEDWDFALYKSTDCESLGEPIRCNFFDNSDRNSFVGIGQDPTGDWSNIQYEDWLEVAPGEDYYLMINNFRDGNSGFSIQFSGNIFTTNPGNALDCSIVSNILGSPVSACESETVTLNATTTDALSYSWWKDNGTGFQEIIGESEPIYEVSESALYQVKVDLSSGYLISDVQVTFSAVPKSYPVSDGPFCSAMSTYDLSEKDSEVLGIQDPSKFVVSYYNSSSDAIAGVNVLPKQVPLLSNSQTIYVRIASAENLNCFDVSQQFELIRFESPVLDFSSEAYLCIDDSSVSIGADTATPNYSYSWNSGENTPNIIVSESGIYTLKVTNTEAGFSCSEEKTITVVVSLLPKISNIEVNDLQKENTVIVETDFVDNWFYQIDNEQPQSSNKFSNVGPGKHTMSVIDPRGCGSVTEEFIVIGFPKFFTPNGDDLNDYWHIDGVSTLNNPVVTIYDRYGKLILQLTENSIGWDGTLNGKQLPPSDYWFKLSYIDENGALITAKYIDDHFSLKR